MVTRKKIPIPAKNHFSFYCQQWHVKDSGLPADDNFDLDANNCGHSNSSDNSNSRMFQLLAEDHLLTNHTM
jgi:hypothetical protein